MLVVAEFAVLKDLDVVLGDADVPEESVVDMFDVIVKMLLVNREVDSRDLV